MKKLILYTLIAVPAVLVAAVAMEACLSASEHEDCWRMKRHHDAGYPVNAPPEWCDRYLNTEQHGG